MLLKNKRSESEIIFDILSAASAGTKKTPLMYQANLSYDQLCRYLDCLIHEDLLEERIDESSVTRYFLTTRGKELLIPLEKLMNFFK